MDFASWFAQNPDQLQALFNAGGGEVLMPTATAPVPTVATETLPAPAPAPIAPVATGAGAAAAAPGIAAPGTGAAAAPPGGVASGTPPATVRVLGRDTGLTPAQMTQTLGGIGQALRPAGAAGIGGQMLPPPGAVQSMGNPAALIALAQQRMAARQALMNRLPAGLLTR